MAMIVPGTAKISQFEMVVYMIDMLLSFPHCIVRTSTLLGTSEVQVRL